VALYFALSPLLFFYDSLSPSHYFSTTLCALSLSLSLSFCAISVVLSLDGPSMFRTLFSSFFVGPLFLSFLPWNSRSASQTSLPQHTLALAFFALLTALPSLYNLPIPISPRAGERLLQTMQECFPDVAKSEEDAIKLANKMMSAGYFHGAAWGPEKKIKRKDGTIKVSLRALHFPLPWLPASYSIPASCGSLSRCAPSCPTHGMPRGLFFSDLQYWHESLELHLGYPNRLNATVASLLPLAASLLFPSHEASAAANSTPLFVSSPFRRRSPLL
jgi:hypothetical protein